MLRVECPRCAKFLIVDDSEEDAEIIVCAACKYEFSKKYANPATKPKPNLKSVVNVLDRFSSNVQNDKIAPKTLVQQDGSWRILYLILITFLGIITFIALDNDVNAYLIPIIIMWGSAITIVYFIELFICIRSIANSLAEINRKTPEKT